MTIRTKVLLLGVGLIVSAMTLLATVLIYMQQVNYNKEIELRARMFLAVLSVETTEALASNRIEDMDKIVTRIAEHKPEMLDVAFVAVLDRDRRVVAHTDQRLYGNVLDHPFILEAADTPGGKDSRELYGKERLLLVSMPVSTAVQGLPGIRWGTVVAGMRLQRVEEEILMLWARTAGILLLMILLTVAITSPLLHQQLVKPVNQLAAAAREFASGKMAARADVKGKNELALLGGTFNNMAERIEEYTRGLEDEIKRRTHQLERSNDKLSIAMKDLEAANEQLEELATTDGLTGLHNFRYFRMLLEMDLRRSHRLQLSTSLLMIDVDNFKSFNDTHGHPEGDRVLKKVASLLKNRVRATDEPCRYGGEEFAVVLLDTNHERAKVVAEEIREMVATTPFEGEETQPGGKLTISVGVATFPTDAEDEDGLVKAADDALYEAKANGRNRVECSLEAQIRGAKVEG